MSGSGASQYLIAGESVVGPEALSVGYGPDTVSLILDDLFPPRPGATAPRLDEVTSAPATLTLTLQPEA